MYKLFLKNFIDRLIGFVGALVSLPIILLCSLLIKLESKGPAIFKQTRIGYRTKPFVIYKLRTMTYSPKNSGNYFTDTGDSRITRVGGFLRKFSLDELPQFWNLLLGNMSLIGPRPDLPVQRNLYTENQWQMRHQVKPGISGLAQAIKRSECTEKQRKQLDFFYVKHVSMYLDIYILMRTFKILFKRGVQN